MEKDKKADSTKVEVNKVSEIIEYQSGGIVSRQIIKKPNGNLTLFGFDKGESLTEHTSPYEAVVNIIEGEMDITVGGDIYKVSTGEMIIMPPDIPHALLAKEKTKMLLIMIK